MTAKSLLASVCLCVCAFVWRSGEGGCPRPEELPEHTPDGKRLCARMYEHSHADYDSALACWGGRLDVDEGAWRPYIERAWDNRVSAIVVAPGCTLQVQAG